MLRKLLSIVGNILLTKQKIVTVSLLLWKGCYGKVSAFNHSLSYIHSWPSRGGSVWLQSPHPDPEGKLRRQQYASGFEIHAMARYVDLCSWKFLVSSNDSWTRYVPLRCVWTIDDCKTKKKSEIFTLNAVRNSFFVDSWEGRLKE